MSVAFIDVDGTVTRSNICFSFGRYLYASKRISFFEALSCAFLYLCHASGLVQVSRLHKAVFNIIFRGKSRPEVVFWAKEFLSLSKASLFRPSMLEELASLKKNSVSTVLISSSPDFLVALIAQALGGIEYYATEYKCNSNGFFSCVGTVMSGTQKGSIAKEFREKGWKTILAFTDSLQDRPLLEVADEVVAVSPEAGLKRLANKKGWRMIQK